jgi:2-hydroxychromene-2-carboxylate isomerase
MLPQGDPRLGADTGGAGDLSASAPASLDFWFEFASPYSYLSVLRIEDAAKARGVSVRWRPFLLGPIFAALGWPTSPFSIYPAKGAYMWRDVERRAARYGARFKPANAPFPQNGLHAARLAIVGLDEGWGRRFCRAAFTAQFGEGQDISDRGCVERLAAASGAGAEDIAAATAPETKARLREQTDAAQKRGLFGAPSFTVGEELFWGDDRLEDALDWAAGQA